MFIPACMSNEKLTNFYILEQNSETPHGKKNVASKSIQAFGKFDNSSHFFLSKKVWKMNSTELASQKQC